MNIQFQEHIPQEFHPQSRVWVYQSNRLFSIGEAFEIETILQDFIAEWKTHGTPVKGYANLFFGQFVIFMADESAAGVSGCSTDSSVSVVKDIEQKFKVDMFNRQNLAFIMKERVQTLPMAQLDYALQNNFITPDTLYFNNLVATKEELLNSWIIPAKNSWLKTRMGVK